MILTYPRQQRSLVVAPSSQQPGGGILLTSTELQLILGELVATRRQVDVVLAQQGKLIDLLATNITGAASGPTSTPPAVAAAAGVSNSVAPAPIAAPVQPSGQSSNPSSPPANITIAAPHASVAKLLGSMGAIPAGGSTATPASAANSLTAALKEASTGDVLAGLDVSTPPPDVERAAKLKAAQDAARAASEWSGVPLAAFRVDDSRDSDDNTLPPLPRLSHGMTCEWWIGRLHGALVTAGQYAGVIESAKFTFGDDTAKAVRKVQAARGLPVTGVVDAGTWKVLLEVPDLWQDMVGSLEDGKAPPPPAGSMPTPAPGTLSQPSVSKPAAPAAPAAPAPSAAAAPGRPALPSLPTLTQGAESGWWVGRLHVALLAAGCYAGSQDVQRRVFGADTTAAVKQAQAMLGLPTTGEADQRTWEGLLVAPELWEDIVQGITAGTAPSAEANGNGTTHDSNVSPAVKAAQAQAAAAAARSGVPLSAFSVEEERRPSDLPALPTLSPGMTCEWWLERLHVALRMSGEYIKMQEMAAYTYGASTEEAVRKLQDKHDLPDTGVCDERVWRVLLEVPALLEDIVGSLEAGDAPPPPKPPATPASPEATSAPAPASQTDSEKPAAGGAEPESGPKVSGAPPPLSLGADDIRWVSWLHRALTASGFYPSDEEAEDWLFGDTTQEALLYAQAAARVPETGVACVDTWRWLLRSPEGDAVRAEVEAAVGASRDAWVGSRDSSTASDSSSTDGSPSAVSSTGATDGEDGAPWPAVMDGDGGHVVGVLQRALGAAGYHCGEDEPMWWQCGSDTINALRTFQACAGVAETGVADVNTWRKLVAELKCEANNVGQLHVWLKEHHPGEEGEHEGDRDLASQQEGRVWLMGEQRWERKL